MRVVLQRVREASVTSEGKPLGKIGPGLLVLAAFENADTADDLLWMASKIAKIRIFNDAEGKMNLDLAGVNGELLVVSQFTLFAETKKGNRPSYMRSARPETAIPLYNAFLNTLQQLTGVPPQSGEFGADMQISLVNDGPVTITMDSQAKGKTEF